VQGFFFFEGNVQIIKEVALLRKLALFGKCTLLDKGPAPASFPKLILHKDSL
jgi:hypothetical protein